MKSIALKLFGQIAESIEPYLEGIRDDLRKSKIKYSYHEYVSMSLMATAIAFFGVAMVLGFALGLILDIVSAAFTALTLSMFASLLTFSFFYFYPSLKVSSRVKSIDSNIPFAAIYLSTLSSGKMSIKHMMKILAGIKSYGELAREFAEIVRSIEFMGLEVGKAIVKVAEETPSRSLKELLYGIYFNLISGADLYQYLSEKSEILMTEYRERIKKFSQELGIFIEIYLTLIIVGSVFFIVLTSVMNMIGGATETIGMQFAIVFFVLPVISMMFVVIFSSMSPE